MVVESTVVCGLRRMMMLIYIEEESVRRELLANAVVTALAKV